jgi:hypothetical protein
MIIKKGKTNWVMVIIVALVAGVASGVLTVYVNDTVRQADLLSQIPELKNSKKTKNGLLVPANAVSDFNLVFKYGVGGKNILDTFAGKFTKDMIADPAITADFKLTPAEKESIRQKIKELDLFNKESKIKADPDIMVAMSPCSNYYLKAQDNNLIKEISWDNCAGEISGVYRQFSDFMINFIESKKEYKDLPEAQGGYL